MESNYGFFTQAESKVNGRSVWRHAVFTPIGVINIVQYEVKGERNIITFLYEEHLDKAEQKYNQLIRGIVSGKL